jgi:hypothetical protein
MSLLLLFRGRAQHAGSGILHILVAEKRARTWDAEAILRLWSAEKRSRIWDAEAVLRLWGAELINLREWSAAERMINADPKPFESVEDFKIDWTTVIGTDFIMLSEWEVPDDLISVSTEKTDTSALIRLSGGIAGRRYVLKNIVTLQSGQKKTQPLLLPVT